MPWSNERFAAIYRRGLPLNRAIRCGLIYVVARLLWISVQHHFQQSASEMVSNTIYLLLEAGVFVLVLSIRLPLPGSEAKKKVAILKSHYSVKLDRPTERYFVSA